jgi:hypothetical protein
MRLGQSRLRTPLARLAALSAINNLSDNSARSKLIQQPYAICLIFVWSRRRRRILLGMVALRPGHPQNCFARAAQRSCPNFVENRRVRSLVPAPGVPFALPLNNALQLPLNGMDPQEVTHWWWGAPILAQPLPKALTRLFAYFFPRPVTGCAALPTAIDLNFLRFLNHST